MATNHSSYSPRRPHHEWHSDLVPPGIPVPEDSAVTVAGVDDIEDTGQKHYLTLRFEPGKKEAAAPHPEIVTAEVHTDSPAFNEELHPGDLVSVLYEPGNPEHVEVVEQEHLTKAK